MMRCTWSTASAWPSTWRNVSKCCAREPQWGFPVGRLVSHRPLHFDWTRLCRPLRASGPAFGAQSGGVVCLGSGVERLRVFVAVDQAATRNSLAFRRPSWAGQILQHLCAAGMSWLRRNQPPVCHPMLRLRWQARTNHRFRSTKGRLARELIQHNDVEQDQKDDSSHL